MAFNWKRTDDSHGTAGDEMSLNADVIDEDSSAEESVQPHKQQRANQRLDPKLVQGTVLSDREGRLYEKQDERVRLLGRVIKDAHGRLFELIPEGGPSRAARDPDAERREETDQDTKDSLYAKRPSEKYGPLFHPQEIKRIVRFGEVKGLLLSQVMEPNRLRDEHRLLCKVETFEVSRSQSMESFASALLSETGIAGQLQLLTEAMMHKLQLTEVLPGRGRPRQAGTRQPGMLLPGDRVFRLILVNDPTGNRRPVHSNKLHKADGSERPMDSFNQNCGPLNESTTLQTSIPQRFLKPWEFQLSREEALYDMRIQSQNHSFFDRFRGWKRNGEELKKWQALLIGKELDEQLWGVRPPTKAFQQSEVREWAQRALQQAGYDVGVMLPEWEVYWRRKGL